MADTNYEIGVGLTVHGAARADAELGKVDNRINKFGSSAKEMSSGLSQGAAAMSEFVTPAAAVVSVLAIATTAAVAGGKAMFDLARNAAEFGSEFYDAAQITGLSVQTLQSLNLAATQGGVSFDQITGSTAKFSKVLGEAQLGSKEAQKTLNILGVTSTDMETALGQAYQTILKYPDGFEQMAASQKAFGKSGSELLPFLKEFGGDINGLKKQAEQLGIVLDDKAIEAADKFGDTFDVVSLQVKAAAAQFALEFAPVITDGMQFISQALSDNKETFQDWGIFVKSVLEGTAIVASETAPEISSSISGITSDIDALIKASSLGTLDTGGVLNILSLGTLNPLKEMMALSDAATKQIKNISLAEESAKKEAEFLAKAYRQVGESFKKFDTEAAEKETKLLSDTIKNLSLQIRFYGDESTVAQTKQTLLRQGVTNFDSALAKSAISLSKQIDGMKSVKKASDEMRAAAEENSKRIAKADEERFERSVEFFKIESEQVSKLYQAKAAYFANLQNSVFQASATFGDGFKKFGMGILDVGREIAISEQINGVLAGRTTIYQAQKDLLDKTHKAQIANLERERDFNSDLIGLERLRLKQGLAINKNNFEREQNLTGTSDARKEWLQTQINEIGKILNSTDKDLNAYLDSQSPTIKKLTNDIQDLGVALENLKIGQASENQNLFEKSTEGLKELYAAITKGQKDSIIREMAENAVWQERVDKALKIRELATATRPRVVEGAEPYKPATNPFLDGLFGASGTAAIASEADYIKGVYQDLGATVGGVLTGMIQGAGQLLETWILTGAASGDAMAQMAASVIAGLTVQAGIKSIFEVAEGFAAAARYDFVSSAGHFTAAKIYGGIALASLGTGLVIGAAGGLQGGKSSSQSNAPDYYTSNPNNGNYSNINVRTTDSTTRALEIKLDRLSSAVEGLHNMVKTARPGDVLERAIGEKRGLISKTVTDEFKTNSTSKKAFQETINLK